MGGPEIHIGDVGTQSVSIVAASLNKASGLYLGPVKGANTLKVLGNTVEIVASAKNVAKGVDAGKGADVTIGSSNAESVSISGIKTGESQEGADEQAYGIFNVNQAQTKVYGKTVNVVAKGAKDTRAIHVANNTEAQDKSATLTIVGDEVCITAESDDPDHSTVGISAMSHGQVHITGNTVVTASDGGSSVVSINADGRHYTQINGNVNFSYDAPTSGTSVDATVVLNLVGPESSWTGNTVVTWNGTPTNKEEYLSVTGMKLGLSKGAVWTPVETGHDSTTVTLGQKYTALNLLENNDGVINITDSAIDVTVEKMTGTGGTVNLAADLTAEEGSQTGRITIDEADANSKIDVKLKDAKMERNLTSDDLTAEKAKSLMDAGIEAAENVGVTSTVEEGMYNDGFRIDEEGGTKSTGTNSVMQSTLELAAAAPLAINRILMNDVRKRLGDIRTSKGTSGVWARYDGGRLSGSAGLENDFHTIQAGVDTVPGDSSIRFGAALSYTGSEADYWRGNADMDLYGLSAYGLWMGEAGQFVDVVERLASARTDMTVDGGKKGSMDNVALSLSGEFGWRFDVSSLFYVEPQVEATYTFVNADRLELSDGSNYEFDDAHSLLGRP